jgi:hypothetical protein
MFWALSEKFHVRQHKSFMLYNMKLLWQLRYLKVPCYLTQNFLQCIGYILIYHTHAPNKNKCSNLFWYILRHNQRITANFCQALFFLVPNIIPVVTQIQKL